MPVQVCWLTPSNGLTAVRLHQPRLQMTRQHLEGQTMMQPLEAHMSTQHFEAQLGAGVATFHFYFFCQHNKGPVAADKGPAAAPANKWLAAAAPANNPDAAAWARVQGSMQQRG